MQDIAPFEDPKIDLEQYPTGPHLAARLLFTVGGAASPPPMHPHPNPSAALLASLARPPDLPLPLPYPHLTP